MTSQTFQTVQKKLRQRTDGFQPLFQAEQLLIWKMMALLVLIGATVRCANAEEHGHLHLVTK